MFAVLALVVAVQAASPSTDARQLALSSPQTIAEIDTGKLKGDLARLAWSPDGTEFYIQTVDRDGRGIVKTTRHYLVAAASKNARSVGEEPVWASKYWSWKSAQASPAAPALKIAVDQRQETVRSTASPTGGDLAKGGGADPLAGSTLGDVANAASNTQQKTVFTLKLKGETIGEWVNEAVVPGLTFGWAPAPMRVLAFAKRDGGPLMVLDENGHKQELNGPRSAVLPAWSDDGKRIAWLERKDRKKYDLMVAEIGAR
jgi:dipeptidyl aminopeptidase/acylaminoacyl peptidase